MGYGRAKLLLSRRWADGRAKLLLSREKLGGSLALPKKYKARREPRPPGKNNFAARLEVDS